jgi:hypothetical protein
MCLHIWLLERLSVKDQGNLLREMGHRSLIMEIAQIESLNSLADLEWIGTMVAWQSAEPELNSSNAAFSR